MRKRGSALTARKAALAAAAAVMIWQALPAAGASRTVRLPATASSGMTSVRGRRRQSNGGGPTTPLRQDQNWSGFQNKTLLLAFDAAPVRGWDIRRAWLHIAVARGDLFAVGVCDVLAPWQAGDALNFREQPGAACWDFARSPADPARPAPGDLWAWPGSGLYSVAWAHPAARYTHAGPGVLGKSNIVVNAGADDDPSGIRPFLGLRIPLAPEQVAALAADVSFGLVVTDDKGQVVESRALIGPGTPYRDNDAEDIWVFTREVQAPALRPFIEVEGEPAPASPPPPAPADLAVAAIDAGGGTVVLTLTAPADAAGGPLLAYDVEARPADSGAAAVPLPRWALPLPEAPGRQQRLTLRPPAPGAWHVQVRGVDRAGRRSAAAATAFVLPPPPVLDLAVVPPESAVPPPAALPAGIFVVPDTVAIDPCAGVPADDDARRDPSFLHDNAVFRGGTVVLQAAANEVVSWQVIVACGAAPRRGVRVRLGDLRGEGNGGSIAAGNARLFRLWYIASPPPAAAARWHGDACLPLAAPFAETFDVPAADNAVPGQVCQAVWADIHVPRDTPPGEYRGTIAVETAALPAAPALLPLRLTVLPLTLPDTPSFPVELNCYGGLAAFAGVGEDDPRAAETEWRFHRLAREHRLNLNSLPYRQNGRVERSLCPLLEGDGASLRVADWTPFDTRLGPLLDGSAFTPAKGYLGPGAGMPVSHLYLPLNENWPLPLAKWYGDHAVLGNRLRFGEWAKSSRPLEEAFPAAFKDGYAAVARQFAVHFRDRGWTNTVFEFFLNNKYYYKVAFFGAAGGRHGSSFWLLDEPADHDDYAANRFFMRLAASGFAAANAPEVRLVCRADISQPEMARGLLDNVCGLWMCGAGGIRGGYVATAAARRRFLPAETFWLNGGGPPFAAPAARMLPPLLNAWACGAAGAMPYWFVLGGGDWRRPDDLALYYTGRGFADGRRDHPGPLPGVRLKLLRRAQQDIEYLNLLAARPGWSRDAVRRALTPFADDPDAPLPTFDRLAAPRARELRRTVVATLLRPAPGDDRRPPAGP